MGVGLGPSIRIVTHVVAPLTVFATSRLVYVVRSMRTLRFLLITRAGRLTRIGGRNVLRLAQNPTTEALYVRIQHALTA